MPFVSLLLRNSTQTEEMTSQVAQASEFKSSKLNSSSSTFSVEEIVAYAKTSSTDLENTLELLEPSQVANNETAKNTYEECLQLKTYITNQLCPKIEAEDPHGVQNTLDILTRAIVSFEMMTDAADGDWYVNEGVFYGSTPCPGSPDSYVPDQLAADFSNSGRPIRVKSQCRPKFCFFFASSSLFFSIDISITPQTTRKLYNGH
ncbi:hypothetical protein [Absidia glauca]|uniref:Uncharacterized protein n=1 Tax=Absidia glauca TaxID=4829 RepID=A0A168R4A2_ABSGL|nr:hypothetical protein [Absidia glauca]